MMKNIYALACLILIATVLTACGSVEAIESKVAELAQTDSGYQSDALNSGAVDGLDASTKLALGTLMLEETEYAVTSDQTKTLLPLWQALQGGVTAEEEIEAVLRGIEGAMTEEQLAAIAGMSLEQQDLQYWMEEQGVGAGAGFPRRDEDPDARATRQAEGGGRMPPDGEGMPPGGEIPSRENGPPEMATRAAEFERLTEEEREAMMATAQAEGGRGWGVRGGDRAGPGMAEGSVGQVRLVLRPLIELLRARAEGA